MKKKLFMLGLLAACTSTMAFAGDFEKCPPPPMGCHGAPEFHKPCPHHPKINLDEKLKLSDTQKEKAKALRLETREKMRPIMNAIRTKEEQKEIIKHNRNMTAEAQCEQVEKLNNQIEELRKQAHDLRVKNEKDFEALLTPSQKTELKKIKEQARKDRSKKMKKGCPNPHKR